MGFIKKVLKKICKIFFVEKITPVRIPVMDGKLLEGHTAFISGGSGGIGFAIAQRFVANGCKVILGGTSEEKLKKSCSVLGEGCCYHVFNMTSILDMQSAVDEIVADSDTDIDILVNAAGVHGPTNFWEITESDWDSVMDINVKGMFFTCQAFAKYMKEKNIHGHILNISSASALKPGKTPYEISKNAVRSMTLGLADELIRYGIVVNCLGPGPTATNMLHMGSDSSLKWTGNPSGRVAIPEEIANWAVYLASDIGNYVVGDSVYVTGGSGTICIDK